MSTAFSNLCVAGNMSLYISLGLTMHISIHKLREVLICFYTVCTSYTLQHISLIAKLPVIQFKLVDGASLQVKSKETSVSDENQS